MATTRRKRIEGAIDRMAGMINGGHLLAATDPATMLDAVTEELRDLRRAVADWVAWRGGYGLEVHEVEDALFDAAERWDRKRKW